ncbi:MAG TPA: SH3 domain-containing protein, partial [Candidatus Krumholzibacteria bacterium]|nr:SH3 domain-containing protein [Candidatus Krumholzibacteria bacterium]
AVSATAEARINLSRSVTSLPDSTNQRVTAMLVTAEKLIRENNYPAALFFAGRANHTIKSEERRATLDEGSRPMVVAVSAANLRRGPGQNYETMETLPEGTQVVCMDVVRNWCHVRTTGGDSGWIHASLLR